MLNKNMREQLLRNFLNYEMKKCDKGTWEHSLRVGKLCELLALEMGFEKPEVSYISLAGLLHDVGKVFIPEMVNYPGKLADKDRYMISYHPQLGSRFININWSDLPDQVFEGINLHHERLNGTGYPYHLHGDELSYAARIVAVADVFDAMSTMRPYRPALSMYETFRELNNPGYDPDVVLALLRRLRNIDDKQLKLEF
jgi:putative nucleotidyltransferase with HDIG domain